MTFFPERKKERSKRPILFFWGKGVFGHLPTIPDYFRRFPKTIEEPCSVTWENRRHFATPLTVSPRNWLLGNERRNSEPLTCHYSDLVSVSDWLKQISPAARPINQKHYQDLGSDASSAWNFCSRSSDVISRGNQWWHREMSAVFSALFLMCHRVASKLS